MTPIRKTQYGILCKLDKPQMRITLVFPYWEEEPTEWATLYLTEAFPKTGPFKPNGMMCWLSDEEGRRYFSTRGGWLNTTDPERAIQLLKEQGIE